MLFRIREPLHPAGSRRGIHPSRTRGTSRPPQNAYGQTSGQGNRPPHPARIPCPHAPSRFRMPGRSYPPQGERPPRQAGSQGKTGCKQSKSNKNGVNRCQTSTEKSVQCPRFSGLDRSRLLQLQTLQQPANLLLCQHPCLRFGSRPAKHAVVQPLVQE